MVKFLERNYALILFAVIAIVGVLVLNTRLGYVDKQNNIYNNQIAFNN